MSCASHWQGIEISTSSEAQATQNAVSIFKIGQVSKQHIVQQQNNVSESPPRLLLKAFIDTIYSLVNEGAQVEAATYSAYEANIFIKAEWTSWTSGKEYIDPFSDSTQICRNKPELAICVIFYSMFLKWVMTLGCYWLKETPQ